MPKKTIDEKIEDLALMVGRRFDELHREMTGRFQIMEHRFDEIDQRLDRIEYQISGHDRRLSTLEDRVLQLARKTGLTFN